MTVEVAGDAVLGDVIGVLREALVELGRAGRPQEANRFAARAWATVRHTEPELAERINRTMHVLARMETTPTTKETPDE